MVLPAGLTPGGFQIQIDRDEHAVSPDSGNSSAPPPESGLIHGGND